MSDTLIAAIITAIVGPLLLFYLEKIRRSARRSELRAEQAETHAYAVHQSINNRPTSLSDRFDEMHRDIRATRTDIATLFEADATQRRGIEDIRRASSDAISVANRAIEAVREISLHKEAS